jgi:hypothetical protein
MSNFRPALGALIILFGVLTTSAAQTPSGGDPKILLDDSAIRQAALKRAFEAFRQKLALLAGRLENSASEQDRDRVAALRRALKLAGERGVEGRFETLLRDLTARGADRNLDLLSQIVRDNKELRQDLRAILKLLTEDDRDKRLAQRREDAGRLLDRLKELRARQARLQALSDRGKHDGKDLARQQEKLTQQTREVLPPKNDAKTPAELVRKPVEQAVGEQQKAEGQLSKAQMDAAGGSQGRAVSRLDEAIRMLEDDLRQTRQEERERALASLLARCRKMLAWQKEIRTGTAEIERDLFRAPDGKPTVNHSARANKLADTQDESLKEADATLKVLREEGTAVAFVEVFEQLRNDMTTVRFRLSRTDVSTLTQAIEDDLIETLEEMIRALEKAIRDKPQEEPPSPGGDGPSPDRKPKLVNLLQQLKMIHAMQRRVHDRTELYGKLYPGEQAPPAEGEVNAEQRRQYERISKELKDLAGRQERIGKVTREIGKQPERAGPTE